MFEANIQSSVDTQGISHKKKSCRCNTILYSAFEVKLYNSTRICNSSDL